MTECFRCSRPIWRHEAHTAGGQYLCRSCYEHLRTQGVLAGARKLHG